MKALISLSTGTLAGLLLWVVMMAHRSRFFDPDDVFWVPWAVGVSLSTLIYSVFALRDGKPSLFRRIWDNWKE